MNLFKTLLSSSGISEIAQHDRIYGTWLPVCACVHTKCTEESHCPHFPFRFEDVLLNSQKIITDDKSCQGIFDKAEYNSHGALKLLKIPGCWCLSLQSLKSDEYRCVTTTSSFISLQYFFFWWSGTYGMWHTVRFCYKPVYGPLTGRLVREEDVRCPRCYSHSRWLKGCGRSLKRSQTVVAGNGEDDGFGDGTNGASEDVVMAGGIPMSSTSSLSSSSSP